MVFCICSNVNSAQCNRWDGTGRHLVGLPHIPDFWGTPLSALPWQGILFKIHQQWAMNYMSIFCVEQGGDEALGAKPPISGWQHPSLLCHLPLLFTLIQESLFMVSPEQSCKQAATHNTYQHTATHNSTYQHTQQKQKSADTQTSTHQHTHAYMFFGAHTHINKREEIFCLLTWPWQSSTCADAALMHTLATLYGTQKGTHIPPILAHNHCKRNVLPFDTSWTQSQCECIVKTWAQHNIVNLNPWKHNLHLSIRNTKHQQKLFPIIQKLLICMCFDTKNIVFIMVKVLSAVECFQIKKDILSNHFQSFLSILSSMAAVSSFLWPGMSHVLSFPCCASPLPSLVPETNRKTILSSDMNLFLFSH